jgi:hypothetical protein
LCGRRGPAQGSHNKAASQSPKPQLTPAMWDVLQRLARDMGGRGQHPLTNNEQDGVELADPVALLNRAADELDPAMTVQEPRTAAGSLEVNMEAQQIVRLLPDDPIEALALVTTILANMIVAIGVPDEVMLECLRDAIERRHRWKDGSLDQ